MMGNLSKSLASVQTLITGFGYIVGIFFIFTALSKMKHAAEPSSQEKMFPAVAYFVGGVALIFLPSMVQVFSNTAFGSGNALQYIQYNPYDIYRSMGLLIQTAGLIWFLRGTVLLVQSGNQGKQKGAKGLLFICSGILAMNFQSTTAVVNYALDGLMSLSGLSAS